jgi:hypothetical protein
MRRAAHAFKAALHGAVLFCAVLCSVALLPSAAGAQSTDVVSLDEAKQLWDTKQAILIDIREPQEHATGVAQGALLIPMSQLSHRLQDLCSSFAIRRIAPARCCEPFANSWARPMRICVMCMAA